MSTKINVNLLIDHFQAGTPVEFGPLPQCFVSRMVAHHSPLTGRLESLDLQLVDYATGTEIQLRIPGHSVSYDAPLLAPLRIES